MGLSITDSVPNYCALGTEPERDLLKNGVSGQEWGLLEVVTPLNRWVERQRWTSEQWLLCNDAKHATFGNWQFVQWHSIWLPSPTYCHTVWL